VAVFKMTPMQKVVATMVEEASFLEELSRSRAIGHRDKSHTWDRVNYGLGIPAVVAATLAGTSAFSEFEQHNVVAGVLALLSAVLAALTTFLDPSKNARLHQQAATRYGELCGDFRRFRQIDVEQGAAPEKLKNRLEALVKQFNKADEVSPTLRGRHRRGRSELDFIPTLKAGESRPGKA
jgi:hypothetical protein